MPAYTNIPNSAVQPGGRPRGSTVTALRDNPLAIAEGATGAPRVLGKALGSTYVGQGTWSGTTAATFLALDAMGTIHLTYTFSGFAATQPIQVRFSNDNGATYGSFLTLLTTSERAGFGSAMINLQSGVVVAHALSISAAGVPSHANNAATLTVPSNCNAFQIRYNAATGTGAVTAFCLGGLQ